MNFTEKLGKVGASVRRKEDFEEVIRHPNIKMIFLLGGDINYLTSLVKKVRAVDKALLVHIDLMDGIGKDRSGIHLLKKLGVHGIITTKANLVRSAKEENIWVVQRFFIVDSESLKTAIKVASSVNPTAVEILPAIVPRYIVMEMKRHLNLPIFGGGLLKTAEDAKKALENGMDAISTSRRDLWNIVNF